MQGLIQTFFDVLKKLEDNHIDYMIVGSVASMVYGEPRMTHDMDVVISLPAHDARKLESLFPSTEFYCPPLEIIQAEIVHQGQFNLINPESGLKIDIIICKRSEHAVCEFNRRRKMPFWKGKEVYLASPEDVIIGKLEYFRQGSSQKHLNDIRGILAETEIDDEYLKRWVKKLHLESEWALV